MRSLMEPQSNPVPTSQVARPTRNLKIPRIVKVKQKNVLVNGSPAHFRIVTRSVEVAVDRVKSYASLMVLLRSQPIAAQRQFCSSQKIVTKNNARMMR